MIIENKEIGVRFEVKGYEDFEKWLAEHDKQIRADEREKVIEEILSGCVCDYGDDCMGDREDCKTCSDYVISYQRILQLKEQK